MKKGISLVALVITIIVLIILTAAVIISFNNGGIIGKSEEAVFKQDFTTLRESFQLGRLDNMIDTLGQGKITATTKETLEAISSISELNFDKKTINNHNYLELIQIKEDVIYQSDLIARSNNEKDKEISRWLEEIEIMKLLINETSEETIFDIEDNDTEVTITGLKGGIDYYITSIIIPDKIDGKDVTAIGDEAFGNEGGNSCVSLENITIPDSVTSIGNYAFYCCYSLTSITIPDGVISIGDSAFSGCEALESITIPDSVTSIGIEAFYSCASLESITIPDRVTSIGDYAFSGCIALKSITIPDCVTEIRGLFSYCEALESITIPDTVISIGDYAFDGCVALESITIPNTVISIGYSAFSGCETLTSITIPDSVTSIEYNAFSGCTNLNSVTVGSDNVRTLFLSEAPSYSGTINVDPSIN